MMYSENVIYVQKGKSGYLCDSEWDGDSFSSDIRSAWYRNAPWVEGRGAETYKCLPMKKKVYEYASHGLPIQKKITKKGKNRWKCICPRCGMSTKDYSMIEKAVDAYWTEPCRVVIFEELLNA